MTRCRSGSTDDFANALAAAHAPLLRHALSKTGNRPDAEDLVQTTLARALGARHRFTPGTNLLGWLFSIQRNHFVDELRTKQRAVHVELIESQLPCLQPVVPTEKDASEVILEAELHRAVEGLREPFRTAVEMFYFERKSYGEISRACGAPKTTIGVRLYRARKTLAEDLQPTLAVYIQEAELRAQVR